MMVDLVPNRENFEDIYPEESDEDEDDDNGFDKDESDSENESDLIKGLTLEKKDNDDCTKQASEERASASGRLAMLESYARSIEKDRPDDLEACIRLYREERKKAYDIHFASEARLKDLEKERAKTNKNLAKALRASTKETEKAAKERTKKIEKKRRARQEKLNAKIRLREERIKFWPRKVYRIILSLDTSFDMTPASSRRGSIDSLAKTLSPESSGSTVISMSVSYVTHAAWWSPRYDLSLSTPKSSGTILYRAEFCNTTSETWKDAKVTLSTSQTAFQGLGEPIPSMQPWHIRLSTGFGQGFSRSNDATSGALLSSHEMNSKQKGGFSSFSKASEPRNALFGLGSSHQPSSLLIAHLEPPRRPQQVQQQQQQQQQQQMQQPAMQQAYQHQAQSTSLFGASRQARPQPSSAGGLFGNLNASQASPFAAGSQQTDTDKINELEGFIEQDVEDELPSLATQESEWSETGMTATYDIPSRRTIAPSDTMRRHKIASVELKNVHLSYLLVPKLRAAAFLKTRIRNTSSITLLKGPVGLTLDGSFLGNASLPRCSAGEPFSLSLGVDPSVSVTYNKPVVKRSQTGVFQREASGIYTRTCTITNTKSDRAVEGLLLDQIPVSEDERLKIDILQPSGLRSEGDTAKSGTGIPAVGEATEKWGSARATLKKAGELCWNIKIEPSRGVKLMLEYEARFPSTETVIGC